MRAVVYRKLQTSTSNFTFHTFYKEAENESDPLWKTFRCMDTGDFSGNIDRSYQNRR